MTPLHIIAPGVSYLSMPALLSLLPSDTSRGTAAPSATASLGSSSAYREISTGRQTSPEHRSQEASYLEILDLTTLLLLSPERPSSRLSRWASASGVRMVHFGLGPCPTATRKGHATAPINGRDPATRQSEDAHEDREAHDPERLIKEALEMILDRHNLPILVVDTSGANEGTLLLGCFRRLQRRNFANICAEYRSIAGSRAKTTNERFIEMFDTDLIALPPPESLPDWWLQQLEDDEGEDMV